MFTAKDIDALRLIYHLVKEKGYTIQGARDHLANHKSDAEKTVEVIKSLTEIRGFLLDIEKEL